MLKIATDFSGVGSPETALKRLGIEHEVVFACDIDKSARKSYQALHKPQQMFEDITTRPMDFPQLDLYVAGFPCQSFSTAGKRKGFDCPTNGTLFHTLSEFIRINQPKCFILENVKGLVNHDNGRTFQIIKDKLSGSGGSVNEQMFLTDIDGLGYHIHFKVLNTKDFGLPQYRQRIFIVGFKDARQFSFPIAIPLKIRLKDILQDNTNSKYLVSKDSVQYLQENQKFNKFKPLNSESEFVGCITARSNKISADNNFIEVDEKYYLSDNLIHDILKEGGGKIIPFQSVNAVNKRNKSGKRMYIRFPTFTNISSCINTIDFHGIKTIQNNKTRIRRLTPLECFRLQGFTDEEHSICEQVQSDSQLYKQMGNTISVPVIQAILKNIYNA